MSCGCDNSSSTHNPCAPAQTVCDPNNEPLQSALNNFITQFFGAVTKSCDAEGNIDWLLPCDLATGILGFPREVGEGLACYFKRVMTVLVQDILAGFIETPFVKTYVLLRNAPFGGLIQSISFATAADSCTFSIQIGGVDVPGLTGLTANNTPATHTPTLPTDGLWAIGDKVTFVITAITGAPSDLDFTISYEKQPVP